jgi:intracellular septation protein
MQKNNLIFEFIPLIIFFAVYYLTKDLFTATGICILVTWVMVIIYKIMYKYVPKNMLFSAVLLTIFGGFSILFHNKTLVMIKPTVLYWILAISLLTSQLIGKNLIELGLKKEIILSQKSWNILNIMWVIFFIALGFVNLFVAFYFDEVVWVKFKVFGAMLFMLFFMLITVIYIVKQQKNYSKL